MKTTSENSLLIADIWQKIPPDEKVTLRAKAQSTGISTICLLLLFSGTMAIGLKTPWILWGSFFAIPFVFQVASSKMWQTAKPRLIVEYTAVRATACCYASQAHGHELNPTLIFKGALEPGSPAQEETHNPLIEDETPRGKIPVWVTLFPDSLVIFSETSHGAQREFAHTIFDNISLTSEEPDEALSDAKRLIVTLHDDTKGDTHWILTSPHPANLVACERKLHHAIERKNLIIEESRKAIKGSLTSPHKLM